MNRWKKTYMQWLDKLSVYKNIYEELLALGKDDSKLEDAFYKELSFGTSGLRGIMGLGTNRMNEFVVAKTTKAIANYLNNERQDLKGKKVVISYDSRHNSRKFAKIVARVLAKSGIEVLLFERLTAVSIMAFAIKELGCAMGIMITASHNNKLYNGYKVYNEDGHQILEDEANRILAEIDKVDIFDRELLALIMEDDQNENNQKENNQGKNDKGDYENITLLDNRIQDRYVEELYDEFKDLGGDLQNLEIIYSNLNGTGREPITKLLDKFNIGRLQLVESQMEYDGDFTTCPDPNPEYFETYREAQKLWRDTGIEYMLLTDPDCDRLGMVKGNTLFSGNQIATLMSWYMREQFREAKAEAELKDYVLIRSVVSSPIIDKMLADYGVEPYHTLIGFKYMGQKAEELIKRGKKLFIAFEEGNGFLMTQKIRDKDGISSTLILSKTIAYAKERGLSLEEVLEEVYRQEGYHREDTLSYTFLGSEGEAVMDSLLEDIRENSFKIFSDLDIFSMKDYLQNKQIKDAEVESWESGLPPSNIIELEGQSFKLLFRRSGTEPKLKAYIICYNHSRELCLQLLDKIKNKVDKLVEERRK